MGEFEEKLNSILSSPKDMEKILSLARELQGSFDESGPPPPEPEPDLDPKLLGLMTKLMGEFASEKDDKAALIEAIKPFVKQERRETLDRAVKVARLTRVARRAFSELGGDLHLGL